MAGEHPRAAGRETARTRGLGCTRCPALVASRTQVVPGTGAEDARVLAVGVAPGADEDALGTPLAGQGRALLDRGLAEAGLGPADTFVTTLVKCRPPGNRDPSPAEVASCSEHLVAQVELVRPLVVLALGGVVTKLLRGDPAPIRDRRGRVEPLALGGHGVWLLPVFHPEAALYTPAATEQLRQDLLRLPELLTRERPEVAPPPPAEPPEPEPVAGPGQLGLF